MEHLTNDRESFQRFLAAFYKRINDNEDDRDILPLRPLNWRTTRRVFWLEFALFGITASLILVCSVWVHVTRRVCHFTGVLFYCNIHFCYRKSPLQKIDKFVYTHWITMSRKNIHSLILKSWGDCEFCTCNRNLF